ncbi:MAG: TIGR03085 family metal-binding protein [Bowdeniella nasicola]|nr:TIGR03085 family metal-binding protein [Bowdeniella nasicola]
MTHRPLAVRERHDLVALSREVGPDAPTLCDPWTSADLLAHLYVRENCPKALPGIAGGPLAHLAEREMVRALDRFGFSGLADQVLAGPPAPMKFCDSQANTLEYFVHHEDLRRAQPGWEVRRLRAADRLELARRFGTFAALLPSPTGGPVFLQSSDLAARTTWLQGSARDLAAKRLKARLSVSPAPLVTRVRGPVAELIVWAFGRTGVARVDVDEVRDGGDHE